MCKFKNLLFSDLSVYTDEVGPAKTAPCAHTPAGGDVRPLPFSPTSESKSNVQTTTRVIIRQDKQDRIGEQNQTACSQAADNSKGVDITEDTLDDIVDDVGDSDDEDDVDKDDDFASMLGEEINDEVIKDEPDSDDANEMKVTRSGRKVKRTQKFSTSVKRKPRQQAEILSPSSCDGKPVITSQTGGKKARLTADDRAKMKTFAKDIDDGEEPDEGVGQFVL